MSITNYVNEKYKLDIDSQTIQHWFVEAYEPDNEGYVTLSTNVNSMDQEWLKTMKKHLKKEFGKENELLVEWQVLL